MYVCMYVCVYVQHTLQIMGQLGRVANPARGQLNRANGYFLVSVRA